MPFRAEERLEDTLVTPDFDVQPTPLRQYYTHLDQRLGELQSLLGAQGAALPSTYEKYLHGTVPAGAGGGNPLVSAKEYYEQLKQLRADSQVCARALGGRRAAKLRGSLWARARQLAGAAGPLVQLKPAPAGLQVSKRARAAARVVQPMRPPPIRRPPDRPRKPSGAPTLLAAGLLPGGARGVPRPAVGGRGRGGPRRVHLLPLHARHH